MLRDSGGTSVYVFHAGRERPLPKNAMLYDIKVYGDFTSHGFWATLVSRCAENSVNKRVSDLIKAQEPKYLGAVIQLKPEPRSVTTELRSDLPTIAAEIVTGPAETTVTV